MCKLLVYSNCLRCPNILSAFITNVFQPFPRTRPQIRSNVHKWQSAPIDVETVTVVVCSSNNIAVSKSLLANNPSLRQQCSGGRRKLKCSNNCCGWTNRWDLEAQTVRCETLWFDQFSSWAIWFHPHHLQSDPHHSSTIVGTIWNWLHWIRAFAFPTSPVANWQMTEKHCHPHNPHGITHNQHYMMKHNSWATFSSSKWWQSALNNEKPSDRLEFRPDADRAPSWCTCGSRPARHSQVHYRKYKYVNKYKYKHKYEYKVCAFVRDLPATYSCQQMTSGKIWVKEEYMRNTWGLYDEYMRNIWGCCAGAKLEATHSPPSPGSRTANRWSERVLQVQ